MTARFLTTCSALLCGLLMVASCKKEDGEQQPIGMCGVVYHPPQQVLISVQYDDGAPVSLDSFVVADSAGVPVNGAFPGRNVSGSYSINQNPALVDSNGVAGRYCLLNEVWLDNFRLVPVALRAYGYTGGQTVFSEPYTVGMSNNRLVKTSGKELIVIPR